MFMSAGAAELRRDGATNIVQYLTFTLDREYYGIELLQVQEIKGNSAVTAVPNAPSYVKGVMNLRGNIVPVIDLRSRLGLPTLEYSRFHVIIVVMIQKKTLGILVDAVSDVLNIAAGDIQPPPEIGLTEKLPVAGLALAAEKVVVLLDIGRVVGAEVVAM
jgi:purine-binding chemotaxis protein CheW